MMLMVLGNIHETREVCPVHNMWELNNIVRLRGAVYGLKSLISRMENFTVLGLS